MVPVLTVILLGHGESPSALVRRLYPLWQANPAAWVVLLPLESILERCAKAEAQPVAERGPLWGIPFAVKDNIHTPTGATTPDLPTTGACKAYTWDGPGSPVVQALVDAGGIVVGKSNLDQFAAGLNGTRSPFGTARNGKRMERCGLVYGSRCAQHLMSATSLVGRRPGQGRWSVPMPSPLRWALTLRGVGVCLPTLMVASVSSPPWAW